MLRTTNEAEETREKSNSKHYFLGLIIGFLSAIALLALVPTDSMLIKIVAASTCMLLGLGYGVVVMSCNEVIKEHKGKTFNSRSPEQKGSMRC